MKLRYRIKYKAFLSGDILYFAQYRILGIWMNINYKGTGQLLKWNRSVQCTTPEQARARISDHKKSMELSKNWYDLTTINGIFEDNV